MKNVNMLSVEKLSRLKENLKIAIKKYEDLDSDSCRNKLMEEIIIITMEIIKIEHNSINDVTLNKVEKLLIDELKDNDDINASIQTVFFVLREAKNEENAKKSIPKLKAELNEIIEEYTKANKSIDKVELGKQAAVLAMQIIKVELPGISDNVIINMENMLYLPGDENDIASFIKGIFFEINILNAEAREELEKREEDKTKSAISMAINDLKREALNHLKEVYGEEEPSDVDIIDAMIIDVKNRMDQLKKGEDEEEPSTGNPSR